MNFNYIISLLRGTSVYDDLIKERDQLIDHLSLLEEFLVQTQLDLKHITASIEAVTSTRPTPKK